jgi:hypothetical protein
MCLYIDRTHHPRLKPFTAGKFIPVYKILGDKNYSPYQNMLYRKAAWYGTNNSFEIIKDTIYGRALHAYTSLSKARRACYGFSERKIVRMYIPTRALYYLGTRGDICSNAIFTDKMVDVTKRKKNAKTAARKGASRKR